MPVHCPAALKSLPDTLRIAGSSMMTVSEGYHQNFLIFNNNEITACIAVRLLPDKQCQSDVMPTRILKCNIDLLAPFLTELFNCSLALGTVPDVFKAAFITLMLKKSDADTADITQYRPISNLPVLSKLLERDWLLSSCWIISLHFGCCPISNQLTKPTTRLRRRC